MRVIFLLAALTIASMPAFPVALPTDAPRVALQNSDCVTRQRSAQIIGEALGFSRPSVDCATGKASLEGAVSPHLPSVSNLITYSVAQSQSLSPPPTYTTFQVPSDIPWASATGTIVAYVTLDALLLAVRTDNALETAFALESAGISRDDMIGEEFDRQSLFVRVRPITIAQILKIARIAKLQKSSGSFEYTGTAFVRDCNPTIASLGGLALLVARERANVMARAAQTALAQPLGVVDPGGQIVDAVCGLGNDATMHQLAVASENAPTDMRYHSPAVYATIVRSINAAWRLKLPANLPGESWLRAPDFAGRWWAGQQRVAFLADGRRARAGAVLPNTVVPDRVSVLIPDWTYDALQNSPYTADLTHMAFGISPLLPEVVLHAANTAQLELRVTNFQKYVSQLAMQSGKHPDLSFLYGQDDCRTATNAALFEATSDAIAGLHGKPIRYLQEESAFTVGGVSCTYEPAKEDLWSDSSTPKPGGAVATVVVGY